MKHILLLFLIFLTFAAKSQVILVSGCDAINGAYYLSGTTPDGRNTYQANISLPYYCPPCSPQKISVGDGYLNDGSTPYTGWQLISGSVEAYNTNLTTPNPPETGWIKKASYGLCPTNPTITYPTVVESQDCSNCNWDDPTTWLSGTVPTSNNHVSINGNVILNVDASCYNLKVNPGKSLTDVANKVITVKGKFENDGQIQIFHPKLGGYIIPQTLDGSKLNIQNLTIDNIAGVTLTGNLDVLIQGGSSLNNINLATGTNITLGNYNLTCHGVSGGRIVSNGVGSLKYQLPGGVINKQFPIGTATDLYTTEHYGPVTIAGTANSASGDPVTLAVRAGSFDASHTIPANANKINIEWSLSSDHTTLEQPYSIKFGWGAYSLMPGGFNVNQIYVKRWNGSNWENKAGPKVYESYPGTSYGVTATNVTEFSSWGVFDSDAVLPVELADFTAKPENKTAILNWTTTEETNSERFVIEHSVDSKKWSPLGEMSAKGESRELQRYTYTHQKPEAGDNYYRLKMLDKDGTFAYSRIRNVRFDFDTNVFIYPNPVSDRIYLSDAEISTVSRVYILDASGKKVLEPTNDSKEGISIKSLPSGIYLLKITKKNGSEVSKKLAITH